MLLLLNPPANVAKGYPSETKVCRRHRVVHGIDIAPQHTCQGFTGGHFYGEEQAAEYGFGGPFGSAGAPLTRKPGTTANTTQRGAPQE